MKRTGLALLFGIVGSSVAWGMGCSSSNDVASDTGDGGGTRGDYSGDSAAAAPFALAVPCTDSIDSIYADPGPLPAEKGAIIRCAVDTPIAMADLLAKSKANVSSDYAPAVNTGYTGRDYTSGAKIYRILYRTERGDTASSPGYSSAKVFIPDTPRAAKLPILIGGRGSRGQAARCTASKEDPTAGSVQGDYIAQAYPMVGLGLAILIPDLAGYANYGAAGNPVSGYDSALDVGKSTLDGARAFKKMFPDSLSDQTVLIGHSQGGHTALSALAMATTYGAPDINVAAVATFAPLWLNQRTWGALFLEQNTYPIAGSPGINAIAVWYHYTHGELLDGPGHGLDPFATDKRDGIKHFVDTDCYPDGPQADLTSLGTIASDLYDPAFVKSVKYASAGGDCNAGDDVCTKWVKRYVEDRPALSGTVPLLIAYGGSDTSIPKDRMQCVFDKLVNDKYAYTVCVDPTRGHTGTVRTKADYVADWIAARTLGAPEPAKCAFDQSAITDDAGAPVICATPPPND